MIDVSCAIIVREKKILAVQKSGKSDHPFQWEFPGGKIKPDETAEASVLREILEELTLELEILKALQPIEHDYKTKQIRLFPFVCHIKKGTLQLTEHLALRWLTASELEELQWAEADRQLIQKNMHFFNSAEKWTL